MNPSLASLHKNKVHQASKDARTANTPSKVAFRTSLLKGGLTREPPRVLLYRVAFAFVTDAKLVVCGGEVTSTKRCLRKCGLKECTNHIPGYPEVIDSVLPQVVQH